MRWPTKQWLNKRWLVVFALLTVAAPALALSDNDRVTVGSNITVAAGETAGDIACVFCTVKIHGTVNGDVAVLFGSVTVDAGQTISGDVAALGANLNLGDGAVVGGDVAIAAGDLNQAPGAGIRGDRKVLPGRGWLLIPFAPLLIVVGLIWLIVWIVERNRYSNRYPRPPYPPAPYPPAR